MSTLLASALTIVALSISTGDAVVVDGTIATAYDGTTFDAAEVFDAEAGGLRVVSRERGRVRYEASGAVGAACAAAGVSSPCLVPRLPDIAHDRLLSVEELRGTLRGAFALSIVPAPIPVSKAPFVLAVASIAAGLLALFALFERARRATPFGRVRVAAAAARRATKGDPTLAHLRDDIARLVSEAADVEKARRACTSMLERARGATHREEHDEIAKTESDLAAASARLAEIAAALRLVPMRVREHRGLAKRLPKGAAMRSVSSELDLRDRALAELD